MINAICVVGKSLTKEVIGEEVSRVIGRTGKKPTAIVCSESQHEQMLEERDEPYVRVKNGRVIKYRHMTVYVVIS